ncbi:hypothetical protein P3T73_06930 [Kiritimatiellota bacterium B12222]|nr:hypothetical protein P3T73_06930 [Kiritimatiellota bacterium B12222]
MKIYMLLFLLIYPLMIRAQDQEMETRYYPVDSVRWMKVSNFINEQSPNQDPFSAKDSFSDGEGRFTYDQKLIQLFKRYGIEFPEGASLMYEPLSTGLVAVNTLENLKNLEEVIGKLNVMPDRKVPQVGLSVEEKI